MQENANAENKTKKRDGRRTRSRSTPTKKPKLINEEEEQDSSSESDTDSKSEGEETDDGMTLKELEEQLEKNAAMQKLTVTNVKSILHHVLSDKRLIALAKTSAGENDTPDKEPGSKKDMEPKMTRARCKQTEEERNASYMHSLFVDMELSEDSGDDQEYTPDVEAEVFDDDSIPSLSDLQSPNSSLILESGDGLESESTPKGTEDIEKELFKIPDIPLKQKGDTEEELISRRTRSKFPLKDLSLEALEAAFCAPDFDPEIYDSPIPGDIDEEDADWKTFLGSLMREEPSINDSIDDLDDDFNYMENEDDEVIDQEEYRNDRAVRVSQRELQDMFDELLEGFKPLTPGVEEYTSESATETTGDAFTDSQRLQLAAQFQQHLQLLVQSSLLCYYDDSLAEEATICKDLVKELKVFNDRAKELAEKETSTTLSAFCLSGIEDAAGILEAHKNPPLPEHCHYFNPVPPGENEQSMCKKKPLTSLAPIPCMAANKFIKCPFFALYPELIPTQGMVSRSTKCTRSPDLYRLRFTHAEDNLLAIGISQFKHNAKLISQQLLPTKTPKQLKNRKKNLCSKREPLNPVKVYTKTKILPPLTTDFYAPHPREMPTEPLCKSLRSLPTDGRVPEWVIRVAEKYEGLPKRILHEEIDESVKAYMKRNQLRSLAVKDEEVQNQEDCSDIHGLQPSSANSNQDAMKTQQAKSNDNEPVTVETVTSSFTQGKPIKQETKDNITITATQNKSQVTSIQLNPIPTPSSSKTPPTQINLTTTYPILSPTLIQVLPAIPMPIPSTRREVNTPRKLIPLQPLTPPPSSGNSPKPMPKLKATSPFNTIRPMRRSPVRSVMKHHSPVVSPLSKPLAVSVAVIATNAMLTSSLAGTGTNANTSLSGIIVPMETNGGNKPPTGGKKSETAQPPTPGSATATETRKIKVKKSKKSSSQKFNWEQKLKEKTAKYADHYFQKAKEVISAKQPELWMEFLMVMDCCNTQEESAVEIYKKISSLLKDFPDLVDEFVIFLTESEAAEVGKFMEWLDFDRARKFLLSCEALFFKNMSHYAQLLKKLLECYDSNPSSTEFVETIRPLLRGNQALIDDFIRFFPDLPPPPCKEDEFEVIVYNEETGGFGHVDDFEEINLMDVDADLQFHGKKNGLIGSRGPKLNKNIRLPTSPGQNSTRRTARNAKRAAVRTLTTGVNNRKPRPRRVLLPDDGKSDENGISSYETSDGELATLISSDETNPFDVVLTVTVKNETGKNIEVQRKDKGSVGIKELSESPLPDDIDEMSGKVMTHGTKGTITAVTTQGPSDSSKSVTGVEEEQRPQGANDSHPSTPGSVWSKEDDRMILAAFLELDNCDSAFAKISQKVKGKTSLDVLNRFKDLMKMYAVSRLVEEDKISTNSPNEENSSSVAKNE